MKIEKKEIIKKLKQLKSVTPNKTSGTVKRKPRVDLSRGVKVARFIIQNKVYDTMAMEFIGTVRKWYAFQGWLQQQFFGKDKGFVYDCKLYRSAKGNYLLLHEGDSTTVGEAITESEAKELLMHSNYEKYAELYGPLEEA